MSEISQLRDDLREYADAEAVLKGEIKKLREELRICRNIRSDAVARLFHVLGFLDGMTTRLAKINNEYADDQIEKAVKDCRKMAESVRNGVERVK